MNGDTENKQLKKIEQESTWSEEDEEMVQVAIDACKSYQESLLSDSRFDKAVKAGDWLKSLRERVQFKWDWSEKDEEIHKKCICAMRASACGFPEEEKFVEQVDNWFKSIKDKIQPQIKQGWNKDDEDMLYKAIAVINRLCDFDGSPINTKRIDNRDIEYIRADAFIERTCEWIKMMWSETDDRFKEDYTRMLIENYKNYIKGE